MGNWGYFTSLSGIISPYLSLVSLGPTLLIETGKSFAIVNRVIPDPSNVGAISPLDPLTWRIIPVSKSPIPGVVGPLPNGPFHGGSNGGDPNYLLTVMTLQANRVPISLSFEHLFFRSRRSRGTPKMIRMVHLFKCWKGGSPSSGEAY